MEVVKNKMELAKTMWRWLKNMEMTKKMWRWLKNMEMAKKSGGG